MIEFLFDAIRSRAESLLRQCGPFELCATNGEAVQRRAEASQVRELEARAAAAESKAFSARIKIEILNEKIAALEAAEGRRRHATAESAVQRMIEAGTLKSDDTAQQIEFHNRFVADPTLVPLVVGKAFNRRMR